MAHQVDYRPDGFEKSFEELSEDPNLKKLQCFYREKKNNGNIKEYFKY